MLYNCFVLTLRFRVKGNDMKISSLSLQWRPNERDGVSNHQHHDCLLNRLFKRSSKKTSNLRVTGLCAGNSPVIGEFPAQMASNAENVSIWRRHHVWVLDAAMAVVPVNWLYNGTQYPINEAIYCHTHVTYLKIVSDIQSLNHSSLVGTPKIFFHIKMHLFMHLEVKYTHNENVYEWHNRWNEWNGQVYMYRYFACLHLYNSKTRKPPNLDT